ncbi:MAG TPA: bifunctional photosynthetic reaction center subunit L/M [Roseiflexaceae bacterium]|nr:bifunctional photosynthetic reaction center subunit L/M [Roseiflexaceae bacterium]
MSNDEPRAPSLEPDPEPGAPPQPVTPPARHDMVASEVLAVADAKAAEVIPLSIVDEFFRRPGKTLLATLFGADPLDFWLGRFYVGFFGVVSALGIAIGVLFYLYNVIVVEGTINLIAARLDPPPIENGLAIPAPDEPGFYWFVIMVSATVAFLGWLLRQVDISRKLDMSYEVPMAFGAVVSSWLTLQWFRPIAMGSWGNGFPLGITHHLDWVSNIGYQYFNFFYNPFHAIGITLLFTSTLFLAMHGSTIMSGIQRPGIGERNIDVYWRGIVGYSIGEIGIHRVAFWTGASSVLFANVCIFLSGTLVYDWNGFWAFWDRLPIWSNFSYVGIVALGAAGVGIMLTRRDKRYDVDLEAEEHGGRGLESHVGRSGYVYFMDKLLGNGQVGPIYLGYWGLISVVTGAATTGIILLEYLYQVNYNAILFVREFPNLSLNPPVFQYGLGIAPWHEGGAWIFATFLLHISVLTWWARIYSRARRTGLGTQLAWGFAAALSLYFVIYLIRPILLGTWSQAPGHGLRALLDWTNYVSIQSGNFYYNPFHMISIFFLLGSTLLLAMHGATIVATSPYKSELELKETEIEGPGTHRAQLFWRWVMGFNANAASIHYWSWWFAALCGITGAIGLLLSLTAIPDWFAWGEQARIVSPLGNPDWSQFIFFR